MTEKTHTQQTRVAILIENGVEDAEFQIPYNAIRQTGAEVVVLGSRLNETYKGKQAKLSMKADATTSDAQVSAFDAVIIPGGQAPDTMRTNSKTVRFVREAMNSGKLVAAICHGPQVLIEGDLLRGKRATGFTSIRKDMENAGALFVDEPLVRDGNLLTSRRPGDLPVFTTAIINRLGLTTGQELPLESDLYNDRWQQLAEDWGGSTKDEIIDGINTAIRGERYALSAFEHYAEKASDAELKGVFADIIATKRRHIAMLETRLGQLGGKETLQAAGSGAWATLKSWLQSSNEVSLLQRALGDLQTGVVDTYNFRNQFTDPVTVRIFAEMEIDIAKDETRIAELLRARTAPDDLTAASPTTGAAVSSAS